MVLIKQENGIAKKFACLKCIKGHRSSKCEHSDRELIEIRRKGRPVSQCESCRHLRKMKQVHIKCVCASKLDSCLENHTAAQCLECKSSKSACSCTREMMMMSSSSCSSEGSITPPVLARINSQRTHLIPIHDPSDDIDSDTPQYKPENESPDKTAVLGNLTNTSSEELMNKIYSAFDPHHNLQEDHHPLVELSDP